MCSRGLRLRLSAASCFQNSHLAFKLVILTPHCLCWASWKSDKHTRDIVIILDGLFEGFPSSKCITKLLPNLLCMRCVSKNTSHFQSLICYHSFLLLYIASIMHSEWWQASGLQLKSRDSSALWQGHSDPNYNRWASAPQISMESHLQKHFRLPGGICSGQVIELPSASPPMILVSHSAPQAINNGNAMLAASLQTGSFTGVLSTTTLARGSVKLAHKRRSPPWPSSHTGVLDTGQDIDALFSHWCPGHWPRH